MKKSSWLIRPKPNGINRLREFLDIGMVAVGWPGLGNLAGIREYELKMKLRDGYADNASALSALKMIVYRMSPGDYVLVPHENSIFFGEITSDYIYEKSRDESDSGFPHQRAVEWFDLVLSREELPVGLQKSTRVVRTAAELTKHLEVIDELLIQHNAKKRNTPDKEVPLSVEGEKMDDTSQLMDRAIEIAGRELTSDDPYVRLRAVELIFRYLKE